MPEIILVNLGVFQDYILDNLRNLLEFGHTITVLVDPHLTKHFEGFHHHANVSLITTDQLEETLFDVNKVPEKDKEFRDGFWQFTSQRLFYVHAYMKQYNRTKCIHIENDVMVYSRLTDLKEIVGNEEKLWLTMDDKKRCIPGFMYIPTADILQPFLEKYDYSTNDMINLGKYFNESDNCRALPTFVPSEDVPTLFTEHFKNRIFDAAAIGQYLGGIDGRNRIGDSRGYINPVSKLNCSDYRFCWKLVDGLWIPHIQAKDSVVPIVNLHIHSKQLRNFMAKFPIETLLIPMSCTPTSPEFDIVIPVGPSDVEVLDGVVYHAKKNIKGHRNIYILTNPEWYSEELLGKLYENGCLIVNEREGFPFSYEDVEKLCVCEGRTGWYYQQLLKLYANHGISDLLENYLVIDADTYFLNPTHFMEGNKPCYALGDEYHVPYFLQMSAMHPLFRKYHPRSGVVHHMFFQKQYVAEIVQLVENYHNTQFWKVFLDCAKYSTCPTSGASEYELYFHYMYHMHPEKIHIRELSWKNASKIDVTDYEKCAYVSVHNYYRKIQVCYPFNKHSMIDHTILYNSLVDAYGFVPKPSDFGDNFITEAMLLDWMRDQLELYKDYLILFVMPSALFNYTMARQIYAALWEIKDPVVCIQEPDGSENMRVLLVKSIPEAREVFGKITALNELGTAYFTTPLVRTGTHVDMESEWGILDLRVGNQRDKLLEVQKYMNVSELL
jgi:hypothetical protein